MQSVQELLKLINDSLEGLNFSQTTPHSTHTYNKETHEAHLYPLKAGGKRVRPLLTLLMAASCSGQAALSTALRPALAVEALHTYSLVHDDLPCMDNDDLRRGKPTVHKVYNEAKALLVGDGLLAEAFLLLSQTDWHTHTYMQEILEVLSLAASAKGIVWGQWLDIALTGNSNTTWEQLENVHTYKTGVLLGACFEMGILCALSHTKQKVTKEFNQGLRIKTKQVGLYIGLAFQIIDDILDSTKSTADLGKTAGKDEQQNKYTAVRILGKKNAEELSAHYTQQALKLLEEILSFFNKEQKGTENSFYQKILLEQIQSLLIRSN